VTLILIEAAILKRRMMRIMMMRGVMMTRMIHPLGEMRRRTLKMMIWSLTLVAQRKYHSVHVIVNYYLLTYSSLFLLLLKLP
jgi:hypothetical protein